MANRTIYTIIRMDIDNENVNEITDEMVDDILDMYYDSFKKGNNDIDTYVCSYDG